MIKYAEIWRNEQKYIKNFHISKTYLKHSRKRLFQIRVIIVLKYAQVCTKIKRVLKKVLIRFYFTSLFISPTRTHISSIHQLKLFFLQHIFFLFFLRCESESKSDEYTTRNNYVKYKCVNVSLVDKTKLDKISTTSSSSTPI